MEYPLDHVFSDLPDRIVEHKFGDDTLLLAPDLPAWLLVNSVQYELYSNLRRRRPISESIESLCRSVDYSQEDAAKEMQVLISMGYNNGFIQGSSEARSFQKELILYLTEDCNLRCRHCFVSAGTNSQSLSEIAVRKHMLEYSSINPNGKVLLTGGEPFLHPDLNNIAQAGHKLGLKISINTNGMFLNREWIKNHGQLLHGLQISIDGFTPDVHDYVRGKGSFEKSWKAVKECVLYLPDNVVFRISVSVFPHNIQNIRNTMLSSIESIDPKRRMVVVFNPVLPVGRAGSSESTSFMFINDNLRKTLRDLDANGWPIGTDIQSAVRQHKCGIGESIVVRANGKMAPCNFSETQARFSSLSDGFEFFQSNHKNDTVDASKICSGCDVRYVCFGGCQVLNRMEGEGPLEPNCGPKRFRSVLSAIFEDELVHRSEVLEEI
jgi:radical SAM protein with 4Fe4S-binding SPASM domain